MHEHRDLVIGARLPWIADDEPAKQPPVDVTLHVSDVIVKGPGANRLVCHVEDRGPVLTRPDLVASPPVSAHHPERPGAVGLDPVPQAVNVEAMAVVRVTIEHVDVQPLSRPGVEHRAWHTTIPR